MPLQTDVPLCRYEDGVLTMTLDNPTTLGGMAVEFVVMPRFGGEPFLRKSMSSGFLGVSGMSLQSGTGTITVGLYDTELSGRAYANYAMQWRRLTSGYHKILSQGYLIYTP